MAAQKELRTTKRGTHPPSLWRRLLECDRPHEEHIFFRNPNLKITCTYFLEADRKPQGNGEESVRRIAKRIRTRY